MRKILSVLPLAGLAACGSFQADLRTQVITLNSDPPGAACVVDRADRPYGHLDEIGATPGSLLVPESRDPLRITCALAGFPTAQLIQPASGMHTYPPNLTVSLKPPPVPAAPPGKPLSILPKADKPAAAPVTATALPPLAAPQAKP